MLYNIFWRNDIAIDVTSVKIIGKYAASGVNCAKKSFITLTLGEAKLPFGVIQDDATISPASYFQLEDIIVKDLLITLYYKIFWQL